MIGRLGDRGERLAQALERICVARDAEFPGPESGRLGLSSSAGAMAGGLDNRCRRSLLRTIPHGRARPYLRDLTDVNQVRTEERDRIALEQALAAPPHGAARLAVDQLLELHQPVQ